MKLPVPCINRYCTSMTTLSDTFQHSGNFPISKTLFFVDNILVFTIQHTTSTDILFNIFFVDHISVLQITWYLDKSTGLMLVITLIIKCGMKLIIHSQTSMVHPAIYWKFVYLSMLASKLTRVGKRGASYT